MNNLKKLNKNIIVFVFLGILYALNLFIPQVLNAQTLIVKKGQQIKIPITLDSYYISQDYNGIEGITIEIIFDNNVLKALSASLEGGILEGNGYELETGILDDGKINLSIVAYGELINNTGKIVFISFDIIGNYSDSSDLSFSVFQCNEDTQEVSGGFFINNASLTNAAIIINSPPIAQDDFLNLYEDQLYTFNLKSSNNETSQSLSYTVLSTPTNGTLQTISLSNGEYSYSPNLNFYGYDHITFFVSDGLDDSNTASITLNVMPQNDIPLASSDSIKVSEDVLYQGTLYASDPDNTELSFNIENQPSKGKVTILNEITGEYSYISNQDETGYDFFTFTVYDSIANSEPAMISINIEPVNDKPVAKEASLSLFEDNIYHGKLEAKDVDSANLTFIIHEVPSNGALILNSVEIGTFSYTPDKDINGDDSFKFYVNDGFENSEPAMVYINITPVNDHPFAVSDYLSLTEDKIVESKLIAQDIDSTSLYFNIESEPSKGIVNIINSLEGTYSYSPNVNEFGIDFFTFTASDNELLSNPATITINIKPVNDIPYAFDRSIILDEDSIHSDMFKVEDIDSDNFIFSIITEPSKGHVIITDFQAGAYTYTPYKNENGTDQFKYIVNDGEANSEPAVVDITINPVNDIPYANSGNASIYEDTILYGNLSGGDEESTIISFILQESPQKGTIVIKDNNSGSFEYTPYKNENDYDYFTFIVNDGEFDSESSIFSINITPVNDIPTANSLNITLNEDHEYSDSLIGHDIESQSLSYSISTFPQKGIIEITDEYGNFTYKPYKNEFGDDKFNYIVNDGESNSQPAVVHIEIIPENDMPSANPYSFTVSEDSMFSGNLKADDIDSNELTYIIEREPNNGKVLIVDMNTGSFEYTPNKNISGNDSFEFKVNDGSLDSNIAEVQIFITPENDAPQAQSFSITTTEENEIFESFRANDDDSLTLNYEIKIEPQKGTVKIESQTQGTFVYTPYKDKTGEDSFAYQVNDGILSSSIAYVNIFIKEVNDLPIAQPDYITITEDTNYQGKLKASDVDSDKFTFEILSQPYLGKLTLIDASNGSFEYNPEPNESGLDNFTFKVNDGLNDSYEENIKIYITPENDPPTAQSLSLTIAEDNYLHSSLSATDIDSQTLSYTIIDKPENGTIELLDSGYFNYIPNKNYYGNDVFTYSAFDGALYSEKAFVNIIIDPENDMPVSESLEITINEDTNYIGNLKASDIELNKLTYKITQEPNYGSVVITNSSQGSFEYSPEKNIFGQDSFFFMVNDGKIDSYWAEVIVNILPQNDPPEAVSINITGFEDSEIYGNLAGSDIDSETLTYTITNKAQNGTITITDYNHGSFIYTPEKNFAGLDSFNFIVKDDESSSETALVNINITPVNDKPIAESQNITTNEDSYYENNLKAKDIDSQYLSFKIENKPEKGTVVIKDIISGAFCYTPDKDKFGQDSFSFIVNDGELDSETAYISISINPVNDRPESFSQSITINEDENLSHNLTSNDIDSITLYYSVTKEPEKGNITIINPITGEFEYIPDKDKNGNDQFAFIVNDGKLDSNESFINIVITPVNDKPFGSDLSFETDEDIQKEDVLFGNDIDSQKLYFSIVDQAQKGQVSIIDPEAGTFIYEPDLNKNGQDSFSYIINDGIDDSDIYTVSINIKPVNDSPIAIQETILVIEDTPANITLSAQDVDSQEFIFEITSKSNKGSITITDAALGRFLYTPNKNENGTDSFSFKVSDLELYSEITEIKIEIIPVNDEPKAITKNIFVYEDKEIEEALEAVDPDSNNLFYSIIDNPSKGNAEMIDPLKGTFKYIPDQNKNGFDSFTFQVSDGEYNSNTAYAYISITPVNDIPELESSSYIISEDQNLVETLIAQDIDSTDLFFKINDVPENGIVIIDDTAKGNFTYTPNENYYGDDQFSAIVNDGINDSIEAVINIKINPINDPPKVIQDEFYVSEDSSINFKIEAEDVDSSDLSFDIISDPEKGILTLKDAQNGDFSYECNLNASGNDSFYVRVFDGKLYSEQQEIFIIINEINDPPEISQIPDQTTKEGETTDLISFTVNDIETPVDDLIITASSSNQSLIDSQNITISQTGSKRTLTIKPSDQGYGSAEITITVSDEIDKVSEKFNLIVDSANAIEFNGIDDYVTIPESNSLKWSGNLTIEARLYPMGITGDYNCIISKMSQTKHGFFLNMNKDQKIHFIVGNNSSSGELISTNKIPLKSWSHIAASYDGSFMKIFINGVLDSELEYSGGMDTSQGIDLFLGTSSFSINKKENIQNYNFFGKMDDIRLWNTARTEQDIFDNMNIRIDANKDEMVGNWSWIDGQVQDQSGNNNSGIVYKYEPVISEIQDKTILEDTSSSPIAFTIFDANTSFENLEVWGYAEDKNIVSDDGFEFKGTSGDRSVTITPLADKFGQTLINILVSDGASIARSTFTLYVVSENDPPIANAGDDKNVSEGKTIILDGSKSVDIDDGIQSYQWTQTQGQTVILSDNSSSKPSFISPEVGPSGLLLEFMLIVKDKFGLESTDYVTINISDVLKRYTIISSTENNGSIAPSGNVEVDEYMNQTFTITPDANYEIKDVIVDGESVGALKEYIFPDVDKDHSITAIFIQSPQIIAASGENGKIAPSGTVIVSLGGMQKFTFTPDSGYKIENIYVDGSPVGIISSYYFSDVFENHTINVSFKPVNPEITALADENGSITPSGNVVVIEGNDITFKIEPDKGFKIKDVFIDDQSIGPVKNHTFRSVYNAHTIRAEFTALNKYAINVIKSEFGQISPDKDILITEGQNFTFNIICNENYEISNVYAKGKDQEFEVKIIQDFQNISATLWSVNSDLTITANYTAKPVITAIALENGSITPNGEVNVDTGMSKEFQIIPDKDYEINEILIDNKIFGVDEDLTFVEPGLSGYYYVMDITSDHEIKVSFKAKPVIFAAAQEFGSISPSGKIVVDRGDDLQINIVPEDGYRVLDIIVNQESKGKSNFYVFTDIEDDYQTIEAIFTPTRFNINAAAGQGGSITPTGSTIVKEGNDQKYSIISNNLYEINEIYVDSKPIGKLNTYSFLSVSSNHSISATFKKMPVITASSGENGTIEPKGSISVPTGQWKEFLITPSSGYKIDELIVDGSKVTIDNNKMFTYFFDNIQKDHEIFVSFNKYKISVSSNENGNIEPQEGEIEVDVSSDMTFSLIPDSGYMIADVIVNNESLGKLDTFTFWNIDSDQSINAVFAPLPVYPITVTINGNGKISPFENVLVMQGEYIEFNISPDEGNELIDVLIDGISIGYKEYYLFKDVQKAHTIQANFKEIIRYTINATAGQGGSITPSGTIILDQGQYLSFSIKQDQNFEIADLLINGFSYGPLNSYAVSADSDYTIHAAFNEIIKREINGRIVASDDNNYGLSQFNVEVWHKNEFLGNASSNDFGYFNIADLPASDNLIIAVWPSDNGSDYYGQFYNNKAVRENADLLSTKDNNIDDLTIILEKSLKAGIKGRVYFESEPYKNILVSVFDNNAAYIMSQTTDENGFYTIIGLDPEQEYKVSVWYLEYNSEFFYALPENQTPGVDISIESAVTWDDARFFNPQEPLIQNIDIIISKGANIKGTVYNSNNEPLSNILVNARSIELNSSNSALSDKFGNYTITGLNRVLPEDAETKGYIVEVQPVDYQYQAYNNASNDEDAQKLATGSDADFYLKQNGFIAGKIVDQQDLPVSGIEISAWSKSSKAIRYASALSNENGYYTINNLKMANDYIVAVFPEKYKAQFYNLQTEKEYAQEIDLRYNNIKNIDFKLDKGKIISGFIYIDDEFTKAGENINVNIWSESTQTGGNVSVDENGRYEIVGLDESAQDYKISVLSPDYMPAYYNNNNDDNVNNDTVYSFSDAGTLAAMDWNASTDRNIILKKGYTIKGLVTYNSQPVSSVRIEAWSEETGSWASFVTTDSMHANYTIDGLITGNYIITVFPDDYIGTSINQTITQDLDDLNFFLQKPDYKITGTIIGLDKDKTLKINAWSKSINQSKVIEIKGTSKAYNYEISGLKPSSDYIVEILSDEFAYQVYDSKTNWEEADYIEISNQDIDHIDFKLIKLTGEISGKIIFPDNAETGDQVYIGAQSQETKSEAGVLITMEQSNEVNYSITGLNSAKDIIVFVKSEKYRNQFYDNAKGTEDAILIDITDDVKDDFVDFYLGTGAQISGKVYNEIGGGISNIDIDAWSDLSGSAASTTTNEDGTYLLEGLENASDFKIEVRDKENGSFFYNDIKTVRIRSLASDVSTLDGNVFNIDIEINLTESIEGTIFNEKGKALANIWIDAWSDSQQSGNGTYSKDDGSYVINGLAPSKDYKLCARPESKYIIVEKTNIKSDSVDVNFWLKEKVGFKVYGFVKDNQNNPVFKAKVEIQSAKNTDKYQWSKTDKNGYFELKEITKDSDYQFMVSPENDSKLAFYSESIIIDNSDIEKNVILAPALKISGKVLRKIDLQPEKNVRITAYSKNNNYFSETKSQKDGYYEILNVPSGSDYIISAKSDSYLEQVLTDKSPGSNIDFKLVSSGYIKGEIKDSATGSGIKNAVVEVYSKSNQGISDFGGAGITDEKGMYEIKGLKQTGASGKILNDYVVEVHANGYPPKSQGNLRVLDSVDFIMTKGEGNKIEGTVEISEEMQIMIDVFETEGNFVKTAIVEKDNTFSIKGLNANKKYQYKFISYKGNTLTQSQWSGANDIGVNDRIDAQSYETGKIINFKFSSTKKSNKSKRYYTPTIGPVRNLRAESHIYRVVNIKTRAESAIPPDQVSNDPNITVSWDAPEDGTDVSAYYSSFGTSEDLEFSKLNTYGTAPVKTRKITSEDLTGDDISYYFYVAPIDKEGRLGPTTSIAFRIDTVPPTNLNVLAPDNTTNININLSIGATGASEMFLSNISYKEGGDWENKSQSKSWKITKGSGSKKIYARFRDNAGNVANTVASTKYIEANPLYTIKAEISGDDYGTIEPVGEIDIEKGKSQTFTITPNPGYEISKLLVDGKAAKAENGLYSFSNIESDHTIQVSFKKAIYIIQANTGTGGSISPSGEIEVSKGQNLKLDISPDPGYGIDKVTVDLVEITVSNNSFTFENIDQKHSIFVLFKKIHIIEAQSLENGSISPSGSVEVVKGSTQTFEIIPASGYEIDSLFVDDSIVELNGSKYSFVNVDNNHTIKAGFKIKKHIINASAGSNGSITPQGDVSVISSSDQSFTINPNTGYIIDTVIVDGQIYEISGNKYLFNNVSDNHSIFVTFKLPQYIIKAKSSQGGSIAPSGDILVKRGEDKLFSINSSPGYRIQSVVVDGENITVNDNKYNFSYVVKDHEINVNFVKVFQIDAISGSNGKVSPQGETLYDIMSSANYLIEPDNGYIIDTVSIDGNLVEISGNTYTFENINSAHTILATFKTINFTIKAMAGSNGKIVPSGDINVSKDESQTFTIIPSSGFQIDTLVVDGENIDINGNKYVFPNVINNHEINVSFIKSNDAPYATNGILNINEDSFGSSTLRATDLNGDELTYTIVSNGNSGTATITDKNTGEFQYRPFKNKNGSDQISFIANDGEKDSNIAYVNITINPVNDIPQALDGNLFVSEDTPIDGNLNASDIDKDSLTFIIVTNGKKGNVIINDPKTGSYTFYPKTNQVGVDNFTFKVNDGKQDSLQANINVEIEQINDAPVTYPQNLVTGENEALNITLTGFDVDEDYLEYSIEINPSNGEITGSPPNIIYIPNSEFSGQDTFSFSASDGDLKSNISEIKIRVGQADIETDEETPVNISLETAVIITQPDNGTLTGTSPIFIYTPSKDFYGIDSFTYKVSGQEQIFELIIYVKNINDIPEIMQIDTLNLLEDTSISFNITVTDADADFIKYTYTEPSNGNLSGEAPQFLYKPLANYYGSDSFVFTAADNDAFTQITVNILVESVNDKPVTTDQEISVAKNSSKEINLTSSDIDSDNITYIINDLPSNGDLSGTGSRYQYKPDLDFIGSDSFTYQAFDGELYSEKSVYTIQIQSFNEAPVAKNANLKTQEDTELSAKLDADDQDEDTLTYIIVKNPEKGFLELRNINTGEFTYNPNPDEFGIDTFTFMASDQSSSSNIAAITITIEPVNDKPEVSDINFKCFEDTNTQITLTASDIENDDLTFIIVENPESGTLEIINQNNGLFMYKPALNKTGADLFKFKVNDSHLDSEIASVMISITPVNDAPEAISNKIEVNEDQIQTGQLQAVDIDGDNLIYSISIEPKSGKVSIINTFTGSYTYEPFSNISGIDEFSFEVTDGKFYDDAQVTVDIKPVNDRPQAFDLTITTDEDNAKISYLHAEDVDDTYLKYSIIKQSIHGTVYIDNPTTGQFKFTPETNYNGIDSFSYQAIDSYSLVSEPAYVTITIIPENDAPVAKNLPDIFVLENGTVDIKLNVSDIDMDKIEYFVITDTVNGTITGFFPDIKYTPKTDYVGFDSFTYKGFDGKLYSNQAEVIIRVGVPYPDVNVVTKEDTPVNITLDSTGIANPIFAIKEMPEKGTISGIAPDITYTPNKDENDRDSFIYSISGKEKEFVIYIIPENDEPQITAMDTIIVNEDLSKEINIIVTDVDNNTYDLIFEILSNPGFGELSGTLPDVTYIPFENYSGSDSFSFNVSDGSLDSSYTVVINVKPVNDKPVAISQEISTLEETSVEIKLAGQDIDNDILSFSLVDNPSHGFVSGTKDLRTYTPEQDYFGQDSFSFKVYDGNDFSDSKQIIIKIQNINDVPIAYNGQIELIENISQSGKLNAFDPDNTFIANDILLYKIVKSPESGSLILTNPIEGQFLYFPESNKTGYDKFLYQVSDGKVNSNIAEIKITINPASSPDNIDRMPPEITINGPEIIETVIGSEINLLSDVSAIDDTDGNISENLIINGYYNTGIINTYEVYYEVSDNASNKSTKSRIIKVINGSGNIMGLVTEIPQDLIEDSGSDIFVEIYDTVSGKMIGTKKYLQPDKSFEFKDLPWQTYNIKLTVKDSSNIIRYVTYYSNKRILLNQTSMSVIFKLPQLTPVEQSFLLTLDMTHQGDYQPLDKYKYIIIDSDTGKTMLSIMSNALTINEYLNSGNYRVFIIANNYEPYEYMDDETGSKIIQLDQDKTIDIALISKPDFNPTPLDVDISSIYTDDGFIMFIVKKSFEDDQLLKINILEQDNTEIEINETKIQGTGTIEDPYIYTWNKLEPFTEHLAGNYEVQFVFKGGLSNDFENIRTYTINYFDKNFRSDINIDQNTQEFAKKFNEAYVQTHSSALFYPLIGKTINLTIKAINNEYKNVSINIPPIPLDYLFIDDYNEDDQNNLNYDKETDYYQVDEYKNNYKKVKADDLIEVVIDYYTFGENAIGNGIYLGFKIAEQDQIVRYNPIQHSDGTGRNINSPKITLPLLLNPLSEEFANFNKLSQAGEKIEICINEKGDGTDGFKKEELPFIIQDDCLVLIDTYHLTLYGIEKPISDSEPIPDNGTSINIQDSGGRSTCFVGSVIDSFSSNFLNYAVLFLALFIFVSLILKLYLKFN